MTAGAPLLQIEKLNVAYGDVQVLWDVDLEVRPGEIVALVGSNGAGKSTLLSTISGLLQPLSGTITFDGHPLVGASTQRIVDQVNKAGTTILMVEQDVQTALEQATRGYVLETGHVTLSGAAADLLQDERVRRAYLGI